MTESKYGKQKTSIVMYYAMPLLINRMKSSNFWFSYEQFHLFFPQMNQTKSMRLTLLEICGIEKSDDGRSCGIHECCGDSVVPGTQVMLRFSTLTTTEEVTTQRAIVGQVTLNKSGKPKKKEMEMVKSTETKIKEVVQARLWRNGGDLFGRICLLAFVEIYGNLLGGRVAEVSDIHSQSTFEIVRIRSNSINGIARVTILG